MLHNALTVVTMKSTDTMPRSPLAVHRRFFTLPSAFCLAYSSEDGGNKLSKWYFFTVYNGCLVTTRDKGSVIFQMSNVMAMTRSPRECKV